MKIYETICVVGFFGVFWFVCFFVFLFGCFLGGVFSACLERETCTACSDPKLRRKISFIYLNFLENINIFGASVVHWKEDGDLPPANLISFILVGLQKLD